jgi:ClpP class serine protease
MNSAAYWICSAADEIVATPSADVGSIGVFTMHTDTSGAEEKAGIKRTVISAGKYKGEAAPGVPLTDDAQAALQARVSECYAMFAGDVAKHRGVTLAAVKAGYGEGRSISAKQALAAGMIDRIATLEDVIGDLSGAMPRRLGASSRHSRARVGRRSCSATGRNASLHSRIECSAIGRTLRAEGDAPPDDIDGRHDGRPTCPNDGTPW